MKYETFLELASELGPYIERAIRCRAGNRAPNYIPANDRILPDVRLACAIRWVAGGSVYDIMTTYGVSHTKTMRSCYCCRCRELFPKVCNCLPGGSPQAASYRTGGLCNCIKSQLSHAVPVQLMEF